MPDKTIRHLTALALAEQGIPVFPCVVDGKFPATEHAIDDASADPAVIDAWWAQADYNVAIEPERAGWCVIDFDGEEGMQEWDRLVKLNSAPPTYTVQTPRGGRHRYFTGSLPATVQKIGKKIDTRGRRSYVLVPPSVVGGKPYSVVNDVDPAPLPEWIATAVNTNVERQEAATHDIDQSTALYRGRAYLKGMVAAGKGLIEGDGGDNTLFTVCCMLRDLGCDRDTSFALISEEWNTHCVPPWSDHELGVKIEHASLYAQNGEGAKGAAPLADTFRDFFNDRPVTRQGGPLPDPRALGSLDGEEKPVEMVVEQWVQKVKFNIFRGRGGSNKSRLALEWSMLIDAGISAAGFTVAKATCLYFSCEDDEDEIKRRRNAIAKKLGLGSSGVLYFDMTEEDDAYLMMVSDVEGVVKTGKWFDLEARLLAVDGPKFVVLDSTYDVIDFAGATKNSDNYVRTVIRSFDRLARKTETTFLCLWHPSRAGMSRGDEGGFATAWDNTTRNAISISAHETEEDTFVLAAQKRNNIAKGSALLLRWSEGALIPVVADEATDIMEHEAIVAIALKAADSGQPISKHGKPYGWVLADIKTTIGRTVNVAALRDHLASECRRDNTRLIYRTYDPHGRGDPAGWIRKELPDDPGASAA